MYIEIRDDVIWAAHLKANPDLYNKVVSLADDETVTLRVDGIIGKWARMKKGSDGRPTFGIRPIGAMAKVWSRYQKRRGEKVTIESPDDAIDPFLQLADLTFVEWYSAEDEEAYGDLQPI